MWRRFVVVVLALSIVAVAPAVAATPLQTSMAQLRKQVKTVKRHRPLKRKAARVGAAVKHGKLCKARHASQAFRKAARGLPRKARVKLTSAALTVEARLLVLPATKGCGGVKTAPAKGSAPVTRVLTSSPTELKVSVALPAVQLTPKTGGGKSFTAATMPGLATGGAPGAPGVPTLAQSFAIPNGATVAVTGDPGSSYTLDGVDLYPAQPSPVDQATKGPHDPLFADKPFTQDAKAYASAKPFPAKANDAAPIPNGALRDLNLGQLDVAGAQYTPTSKQLKVFTTATVDVTFKGGTGAFGDSQTSSPYNAAFLKLYGNVLTNGKTAVDHLVSAGSIRFLCGEEMLIVTSPDLRAAADTLATARNKAGIYTRVVQTGTGSADAGTTADQIRTFAQSAVARTTCIRPSYLTLMGNTDKIPTFHGGDDPHQDIPTDFVYGEKIAGVPLPDLAIGRIPANSLASANTMVSKIIGYEDSPPIAPAFYQNVTVTSYFEGPGPTDQRGFLRTAEQLRTGLIANGKTVTRRYAKDKNGVTTNFDDGTAVPSGLDFTATNTNVVSDVNAGRFLFISRDHGYETGVSEPGWGSNDVSAMTNAAQLPVFWLIVCSAGSFDSPGLPSLAETLLARSGGGGVGVLAASRVSPTEVNNRLAMGLADAVWPNVLPYSGSSTPLRRMGDVLNSGKLHVILESASLQDFYGRTSPTQDIRDEERLYNYFGDPSMQLRVAAPTFTRFTASVSGSVIKLVGLAGAAGGTASVLQDGVPIGKAFINGDGTATVDPNTPIGTGGLDAVIDTDGFAASTVHIRDAAPAPAPDLIVTSVASGTDPSPHISITVKNQGDANAGPFDATVTGTDLQTGVQGTVTLHFADGIPAGQTVTQTMNARIFYNTLTGVADSGNAVAESNETNNTGTGEGPPFSP